MDAYYTFTKEPKEFILELERLKWARK